MSANDDKKELNSTTEPLRSPSDRNRTDSDCGDPSSPELHFEPIVCLPLIQVKTLEENETELLKLRAKLYRYDVSESPPEFKERGTGEVRLLKHPETGNVRIVMRRDKTLKLCANHYILPAMNLINHKSSDKVFVWSTLADLSDDIPIQETLAIRFGNPENAQLFHDAFEDAKRTFIENEKIVEELSKVTIDSNENEDSSAKTGEQSPTETDSDSETD